jgi:predicted  nucleic acid-binding Zn-ribbon protein
MGASQVEALLVVQADDAAVRELETRLAALAPRRRALAQAVERARAEHERAVAAVEREAARHRAAVARLAALRERHARAVAVLDQAHRLREATAAATQAEAARRALADEESALLALERRLGDLRSAAAACEGAIADVEARQAEERAALDAEAATLDAEIEAARRTRAASAARVEPGLLARYERVARRHGGPVLFPIRGVACSHCDTAVPVQRRPGIGGAGRLESCEVCGMLLYAEPSPPAAV